MGQRSPVLSPFLIRFMKIEKGLNVSPLGKASLALHLFEFLGLVIAPASFAEKSVKNENLLVVWPPSMRKTPLQDFLVGRAGQHLLDYRRIFNLQESAHSRVGASPMFVIRRQLSLRVQSNLIEHPP